jgi:hypothetical protein
MSLSSRRPASRQDDGDGILHGSPESINLSAEPVSAYAYSVGKVVQNKALTVPLVKARATLVGPLRLAVCPPAVGGGVATIVVDPVERHSCWALSHVSQKHGEVLGPRYVDGDTATAIVAVLLTGRIEAARLDVGPDPVFLGLATAVLNQPVCAVAPATLLASTNVVACDVDMQPAIASTKPERLTGARAVTADNEQTAAPGVSQVDQSHTNHFTNYAPVAG